MLPLVKYLIWERTIKSIDPVRGDSTETIILPTHTACYLRISNIQWWLVHNYWLFFPNPFAFRSFMKRYSKQKSFSQNKAFSRKMEKSLSAMAFISLHSVGVDSNAFRSDNWYIFHRKEAHLERLLTVLFQYSILWNMCAQ